MGKSETFWDRKASGYSKSSIPDVESYQRKLSETQKLFRPDMRVLEFGCGTGATAVQHAPHVAHIDAIDISEKMLEIGRERATKSHIENIRFTRGTLSEFNAETASLDAVLGLNVIHLLPDSQAVLSEVARILKPGGLFISSTACLGSSYMRFIKLIVPLGKFLGLIPDVFVLTESQLTKEVTDAGFVIEAQWHHGINDVGVFMIARKL